MTRQMSLRQATDCLDITSWRVLRLSRFLGLDAYEFLIPTDEVERIALLKDPDDRYAALREWLLNHAPDSLPFAPEPWIGAPDGSIPACSVAAARVDRA